MDDILLKQLESETEYVHFISLAYSILNNIDSERPNFNAHKKVIKSIELLKAATLVIDDIIDSTLERNNIKSIIAEYGISKAILIGEDLKSHSSIAFIESLKELPIKEKQILDCYLIFEDSYRTVLSGQIEDIESLYFNEEMLQWTKDSWRTYYNKYISIIYKTTSVFIQIPFHISNVLGSIEKIDYLHYLSYFKNVGLAYQIRDDILDVVGDSEYVGKHAGGDIIEKKIRIPFIEYFKLIKNPSEKKRLLKIFTQDNIYDEEVTNLVLSLYDSGAINNSAECLNKYCAKAINEISAIRNTETKKMLVSLAEFIML